jgi:predicted membrane protein
MNTLMQSQIFFFISSIGFVVLWILIAIGLIYVLRALHVFSKILKKAEKDINSMGDISKEMLEDLRDSFIFRFLVGGRKRRKK